MPDEPTRAGESDDVRRGRLLNELFDRRARGDGAGADDTVAVDPELKDELGQCLELLDDLRPAASQLEALIAQGLLKKSAEPQYPAELGPYKIIDFIGRGGMGIVLKAYEASLNRTIALKILRPDLAHNPALLTRFEREAKAAGRLQHPNIVTVHAIGQERGTHYIAMEYVWGTNLAELIRESEARRHPSAPLRAGFGTEARSVVAGPTNVAAGLRAGRGGTVGVPARGLPAETIRHIFRQLLSALDAAHAAGLIHRDVKSSNILLAGGFEDPGIRGFEGTGAPAKASPVREPLNPPILESSDPLLKLADFGLARMRSSQTQLTVGDSILGTPEYMSPEQARGDEDIDHRTDLYSAGVVLYEMLTGRTPFRAETATATLRKIIDEEPPDPRTFDKSVDPVLASLALRLLAKRREDRFGSAREAAALLTAGKRVRSLEHRRRQRGRFIAGLLALALLVPGAWLLSRFGRGSRGTPPTTEARGVIAHVWAMDLDHPDYEQYKTSVFARYGDDLTAYLFHEFPDEVLRVRGVQLLDLDGLGRQAVAVGLRMPLDGCNVFAFDAKDRERWRRGVSNHPSIEQWPDCGPATHWVCRGMAAGDLHGDAGDELVVSAHDDNSYPARISIIDPRTGEIGSTFWHMGHLHGVYTQPDFLGPGRPAIIAWGYSNKLDGFDDPLLKEDDGLTRYDIVTAAMVLDPATMDGLGPPPTRYVPIESARPHAYAFLDMPSSIEGGTYVPQGQVERFRPGRSMVGIIERIQPVPHVVATDDGPRLKVYIGRLPSVPGAAILTVDRNLNVVGVEPITGAPVGTTEEYFRTRWRLIIQNGEYLAD